jgi:hypothetical protein
MWIVAGVIVVAIVVLTGTLAFWKKRAAREVALAGPAQAGEPLPEVHALDDALRTVESLTDAKGSSLLDQVDRDGRTIRDRLASGEAHLDSLRQPDDTGPLLGRVLDEVARVDPAAPPTPGP